MIMTCVSCGLRQFVLPSDCCRRCRAPLGAFIFEISLSNQRTSSECPNQLKLPIGSAIRSMRLRQGRTAVQLALAAAVERCHFSRIEHNLVTPNLETILRILRGIGAESILVPVKRR